MTRRLRVVAFWAPLALLVAWTVIRVLGLERGFSLVAMMAFTPYAALVAAVLCGAALLVGGRAEAAVAAAVMIVLAIVVVPRAAPGQPAPVDAAGPRLDVLSLNLRLGDANAEALVELARREQIDLLCVQELTVGGLRRLRQAGIGEVFEEQVLGPTPFGGTGAGIYARHPLRRAQPVVGGNTRMVRAQMELPGAFPVDVVSVHPFPPNASTTDEWARGLESLPAAGEAEGVQILAGDFNASFDHRLFRDLVATGYVDAADALGRGLEPTWPTSHVLAPPVTIDHVLTDERVRVESYSALEFPDTDHRAVMARLVLPAAGG